MKEFTLMLLAHTLGDYYFQPQGLAKLKSKSTWYVLIHALIYALTMFATTIIYKSDAYFYAVIFAAVTHAFIDVGKQLILNAAAKRGTLTVGQERAFYLWDQAAHLAIILVVSMISASAEQGESLAILESTLPKLIGLGGYELIALITALLAVMKPANVFIKKVLVTEKPDEETDKRLRHGGSIGSLERIVVIAMLYLGQYAAIALVFTAKSIARFKDFENRSFAEYYLYGTLLSVVTTMAVFAMLKIFGA